VAVAAVDKLNTLVRHVMAAVELAAVLMVELVEPIAVALVKAVRVMAAALVED
jgi:hypothetical protein